MKRLSLSIALALAALTTSVATAQATTVVVGSPLTNFSGAFNFTGCPVGTACTLAQKALPSGNVVSPVDGAIVHWHLLGASSTDFSLQVLDFVGKGPAGDGNEPEYKSLRTSAPVKPSGLGLETFTTALPIAAGQTIGLKMEPNGGFAELQTAGANSVAFAPALVDGIPQAGKVSIFTNHELGFNAEIQPAPTLTAVTASKGPLAGGNPVTLEGTQFADVKSVKFGGVPASSFSVQSEGKLAAISPRVSAAATVPVSVTTVAGTATLAGSYTYEKTRGEEEADRRRQEEEGMCHVPKLRGKKLAVARKLLREAHCSVGRVTKKKGATAKTGKVSAQGRKPGKLLPAGTKVGLVLAAGRR